jgi:RHS repeat-associated protein
MRVLWLLVAGLLALPSSALARWYDPTVGTWLSRDSVGAQKHLDTPNSIGPWSYANLNPARYIDPDGRDALDDVFGPIAPLFRWESAVGRQMNEAAPAQNTSAVMLNEVGMNSVAAAKRSAPYQFSSGTYDVAAEAAQQQLDQGMAELGFGDPEFVEYAHKVRNQRMVTGVVTALCPACSLAQGTVDSFERAGRNLGEGAAACAGGSYYQCGRRLPYGAVEGGMLVAGGRGLGSGAVEAGLVGGDWALPVNSQTLDPLNWSPKFWEAGPGQRLLNTGPGIKGLQYVGPPRNLLQQKLLDRYLSESGGRWGGRPTRHLNDTLATILEEDGWEVTKGAGRGPEEWWSGPNGGTEGGTFVDLTAVRDGKTLRVQTVTTKPDGVTMIPSEAAAAARIRNKSPKDELILIPKK